ncbi:uncharacterized protein LOC109842541 [Asparagus officinalis]|uniref:uncharacterized protein LOC109842541 n=1 Tax=Asparagus officinalis TaxID=4686 RepID=UPI00098DF68E|nr:uncharacterized protein LOC109842541 [Asparagus officinalis]
MKSHLKALSLWEVVESDYEPTPIPQNPTLKQIKKHDEEKAKKPKALSCIHSAMSDGIFTSIMTCESPKEAWEMLKEEFEGNDQTKLMQVLNLKREFEMQKMKKGETIKVYVGKLMAIVNQIRLLGETFSNERVVDKILVTVSERYESKISSLEDSKDLSKITLVDLVNALSAVDQRRAMRNEENGKKIEEALLAKTSSSKGKGKGVQCNHCKKLGHEEKDCWHKGKPQCHKCKRFGHIQKYCRYNGEEQANMAQAVEEEILF